VGIEFTAKNEAKKKAKKKQEKSRYSWKEKRQTK
jgi:hypothetical protein